MVLSSHSWHSVLHLGPIAQDASRGAVDIPELLMPNYFDVGSLSSIDCTEACVPRRLLHSRSVRARIKITETKSSPEWALLISMAPWQTHSNRCQTTAKAAWCQTCQTCGHAVHDCNACGAHMRFSHTPYCLGKYALFGPQDVRQTLAKQDPCFWSLVKESCSAHHGLLEESLLMGSMRCLRHTSLCQILTI